MFTGLIEALGTVQAVKRQGNEMTLAISASAVANDLKAGDSIAVSGACLTVTTLQGNIFTTDLSGETLARTTLKDLKTGDRVNLERPLRPVDRLGGHFVTGHVDEVGQIQSIAPLGEMHQITFQVSKDLHRYLIVKGSMAVDGVSLTVNEVTPDGFRAVIIPHTAALTTLGFKRAGDPVNLEADLIGKYVERFLKRDEPEGKISREFLGEYGFLKG